MSRITPRSLLAAALLLCFATPSHAQSSKPCIAYLGVWDRSEAMLTEASHELGFSAVFAKPEEITAAPIAAGTPLADCRLVFLLNLQVIDAQRLRTLLENSAADHPDRKLLALDYRASQADLEKANLLIRDENIQKYWRANGSVNIRRLLGYATIRYLGAKGEIQPPIDVPDFGYYDPDREEDYFSTFASYKDFKVSRGRWIQNAPIAALLIQQSFWITHDTRVIAAQVRALEQHHINPVVIFGDREEMITAMLAETHPDAIVEDRHGTMWNSHQQLEQLDVPYFRPISMLGSTLSEWKANPQGLAFRDVGLFMTVQESWGTMEPVVVGGLQASIQGLHMHDPEPGGIERFAGRMESWLRLKRKPESQKRVAIVYYNPGLGKDDLMRGSPTGMFLDGPASIMRFLPEMKRRGYTVDAIPRDTTELMSRMRDHGRNLGPWAGPALQDLVDRGDPVLIPCDQYERWFHDKLSPENQRKIIAAYGPPPGKFMVVKRHGIDYIVLPRLSFGNVVLMPQPARGQLEDFTLVHSRDVPPPHNYLAFYWWLQEGFHADAVIHWGTHGTLELLPGKEAGMSRDDWPDICIGNLPNLDLWIMDNLAEATLARRRSYAVISDHMVPPAVNAGLSDQYKPLREDIEKFKSLEGGLLKQRYRSRISAVARGSNIDSTLKFPKSPALLTDTQIGAVADYIEQLSETREVLTLHTLGLPPDPKVLPAYLTSIAGRKFLEHLEPTLPASPDLSASERRVRLRAEGEKWIAANVLASAFQSPATLTPDLRKDLEFIRDMYAKLEAAGNEVDGLFRALDGRYLPPGPGPEPIRNPASVPGGRNLYALNPEEIPTKPAWEVAVALIDEFLKTHPVKKVGMDLNGMDTMRDFGVMESQILYLMGVRPVWDRNGLAADVALIPRAELKRPRVDVFIAMGGLYKENFSTRVQLLDKAVRLVSALKEQDNYVREGTLENERRLRQAGMSAERASALAAARIFGAKPGDMSGTNILYLVPNSGAWKKQQELTDVYIDHMSYVYTNGEWGQKVDGLYQQAIQGTQALIRVWASNMTSELSNHHAYEYLGGLSMAVKQLTGKQPEAYIADVRDPDAARMRNFDEVLATNFRTELLNPNWVKGMKEHGYAGAGQAAELVKNTFGWSVTRDGSVDDATWHEIYSVYFQDKYRLGTHDWMTRDNPHAMQEMAAIMLEAIRKNYWKADDRTTRDLARTFTELVAKYGKSGGVVVGGNAQLADYIHAHANAGPSPRNAPGPGVVRAQAAVRHPGSAHAFANISGQRLALNRIDLAKPLPQVPLNIPALLVSVALLLLTLAIGYAGRRGAF